MKRAATGSFKELEDIHALKPAPTNLTLYVAFNPCEFAQLENNEAIYPDPYSGRFGLRASQIESARRAHFFMNWRPPGSTDPVEGDWAPNTTFCCLSSFAGLVVFAVPGQAPEKVNKLKVAFWQCTAPLCLSKMLQ